MENPIGDYRIDRTGIYFYNEKLPSPEGVDELKYVHLHLNGCYVGLLDLRDGGTFFFSELQCSYEKSDIAANAIHLHLNGRRMSWEK